MKIKNKLPINELLLDYHKWYLNNRGAFTDSSPEKMVEIYLNNKKYNSNSTICPNCNKKCEPIPLGLMCNKCGYDKL